MPLRKLQETPTGWGFGYGGIKEMTCEKTDKGLGIECEVYGGDGRGVSEIIVYEVSILTGNRDKIRFYGKRMVVDFNDEAKCWVDAGVMQCKPDLNEYEIWLEGKEEDEYGFEPNPPIVVRAKDEEDALEKLNLPEGVKVKSIERVD